MAKSAEDRPSAAEIAKALVPEAQPAIEWPPPGLDDEHGSPPEG